MTTTTVLRATAILALAASAFIASATMSRAQGQQICNSYGCGSTYGNNPASDCQWADLILKGDYNIHGSCYQGIWSNTVAPGQSTAYALNMYEWAEYNKAECLDVGCTSEWELFDSPRYFWNYGIVTTNGVHFWDDPLIPRPVRGHATHNNETAAPGYWWTTTSTGAYP